MKLYAQGDLTHFLDWTLRYPAIHWTQFPGYVDMALTNHELVLLFVVFVPLVLSFSLNSRKIDRKSLLVLFAMLVVSFVTVYPRFSFFHFQSALVFVSLVTGILFAGSGRIKLAGVGIIIVILYISIPSAKTNWNKPIRFSSGEEMELSDRIKESVPEDSTLYLLGPHSAHYVYANRLPAKPWVDNFGWYFEVPGVQEMVLAQWEISPPDYVLWTKPEDGGWYDLGTYQPQQITGWISKNYMKVSELQKDIWLWKYTGM